MGWFSRKDKPERRFWCQNCARVFTEGAYKNEYGEWRHRLWTPLVKNGVDFGSWTIHTGVLIEQNDSPTRQAAKAADGRLSLAGGGEVSLAEPRRE